MVLARLLTPEQIGIYSLCAAIAAMATIFRDFGVSEYIIQEKTLTQNKLRGAYALAFLMAWVMAALLFSVKNVIADYYGEQGVSDIITILSLNFLILPFASPGFAILHREMAFKTIFLIQFPSTIVHAVTGIILAHNGFSYMSLAWASLANIITQTILVIILRPKESLLFPSIREMRHVWRFGITFSASRTVETIMNNSHELIISRQFGFAQLGLFSKALGLINLFWTNVTFAVTRVAAPAFAASYHKSGQNLLADYLKALRYFTVLAWPFFGFIALESRNIIYILFGEQWVAAAPIAVVLAFTQMISSIIALAPNALIAMGKVKKRLRISLIIAPIHIGGILIASSYNIMWVASIWGVTWLTALILYNHYLSKTIGVTYSRLFETVKPSLIVAIFTVTSLNAASALVGNDPDDIFLEFAVSCVTTTLAWLAAVYAIKHPIADDVSSVFSWITKKHKSK